MSEFMTTYFGPLGREYCAYFYFMSILFFVFFILSIIGVLSAVIMKGKKMDFMFILNSSMLILNTLLAYFVNRLLNTMCKGSVK
jgi:ABC-type multidrug transport system permease subunit